MTDPIIRCVECDGYGWIEGWIDDEDGGVAECSWCAGIGYVYRVASGVDRPIPAADLAALTDVLEQLEAERLRELGYTGGAKKPWEQQIRRDRGDQLTKRP